jgi:hypothetical protein
MSSIMVYNPQTQKYELPPPRWFNKATGEYEDIKPVYFLDSTNPQGGIIAPDKVIQEDYAFRRFLEEKEARRRQRLERERAKMQKTSEGDSNNQTTQPSRTGKETKHDLAAPYFDEESTQKIFREATGRELSKRGATQIVGPGLESELQRKKELEARYDALKQFFPKDKQIEELPGQVNAEDVVKSWRNPAPISTVSTPKKREVKSERERAQELVKLKKGQSNFPGSKWTYAAMRGSYCPPTASETEMNSGWQGQDKSVGTTEQMSTRKWRQKELLTKPWWETSPSKWKSRRALRDESGGRLAINPVTGRLEDLAPTKFDEGARGSGPDKGQISEIMREESLLL